MQAKYGQRDNFALTQYARFTGASLHVSRVTQSLGTVAFSDA
jgi:hypothetical protein